MHLDAGFDSTKTRDLLDEPGFEAVISQKGFPLQAGVRWVVERTNSWHTRGFAKPLVCTERHTRVIDAFIALATPSSSSGDSSDRLDHPPLGNRPTHRP